MFSRMTDIPIGELFRRLIAADLLSSEDAAVAERWAAQMDCRDSLPLALAILSGIGAWIATLCLLLALGIARIIEFDSRGPLIGWGLLFSTAAFILVSAVSSSVRAFGPLFARQLAFASMLMGRILFAAGAGELCRPHYGWGVAAGLCVHGIVTYRFFPIAADRFLATAAALIALLVNVAEVKPTEAAVQLIHLLYLAELALAGTLFMIRRLDADYEPLAYGAVCAILAGLGELYLPGNRPLLELPGNTEILNGLFAAALIFAIGWAAGDYRKLRREPYIAAAIGAAFLGIVSTPGILLSIWCMIIGYGSHRRPLALIGAIFLPLFLSHYYYVLEVTLLTKSGILIGSGIILLAGWLYLERRGTGRRRAQ